MAAQSSVNGWVLVLSTKKLGFQLQPLPGGMKRVGNKEWSLKRVRFGDMKQLNNYYRNIVLLPIIVFSYGDPSTLARNGE